MLVPVPGVFGVPVPAVDVVNVVLVVDLRVAATAAVFVFVAGVLAMGAVALVPVAVVEVMGVPVVQVIDVAVVADRGVLTFGAVSVNVEGMVRMRGSHEPFLSRAWRTASSTRCATWSSWSV